MQVQVIDRLRPGDSVINHDSKPVVPQSLFLGYLLRHKQQMPQCLLMFLVCSGEPTEPVACLGDHQEVDGRLRRDVAEGEAAVVLEDDIGRDLLGDDLVEQRWFSGVGLGGGAGVVFIWF